MKRRIAAWSEYAPKLAFLVLCLAILATLTQCAADDYNRKALFDQTGEITSGSAFCVEIGMKVAQAVQCLESQGWTNLTEHFFDAIDYNVYDGNCKITSCFPFYNGRWGDSSIDLYYQGGRITRMQWSISLFAI
jgi:hypothetical protein